jgi:hypothetical protein
MDRKPALGYGSFQTGFVFGRGSISLQERRVDQLNMDAAILHGLDRDCDLDQLAGGVIGGRIMDGQMSAHGVVSGGIFVAGFGISQ